MKIIKQLYRLTQALVHLALNQTLAEDSKATGTFAIVWHPIEHILFIYHSLKNKKEDTSIPYPYALL